MMEMTSQTIIHIFSMLYIHTQCVAFGTDKSVLFMEAKCSDIHVHVCMYVAMNSGSIQEFRGSKMMFDDSD